VQLEDADEAIGINTRIHLSEAEAILRRRINRGWMLAGVTVVDPETTSIGPDVKIGQDTIIFPGSYLMGSTEIGPDCRIGPNAVVTDSMVGAACKVGASTLEGAVLANNTVIKPYHYVGPETRLAQPIPGAGPEQGE
jgi:bifunctional UDP-N-acetylglucosamine pyrophosphorylase/glucosamine-1-phosphate N-acetyltransferase